MVDEQTETWVVRAANSTTYTPFGQLYPGPIPDAIANPWKFTGQWHDAEIDQYHLRARQYDPTLMRFTSRDPITGKFSEPLTLHKYLYCSNDPMNNIDLTGKLSWKLVAPIMTGHALKNLALSQASYATDSGDWRFFDLAFMTTKFTPYAIGLDTM